MKDHPSQAHPDIPNKPGVSNWVEQAGHLPKYIERIAKHLVSDQGFTVSRAIATAVNTVKKWATGLNHNGSKVSAATQAKAAAAYAEWKAKAAKSKATPNRSGKLSRAVSTTREEKPVTIELSRSYKKVMKAKLDKMGPEGRNKLRAGLAKAKPAAGEDGSKGKPIDSQTTETLVPGKKRPPDAGKSTPPQGKGKKPFFGKNVPTGEHPAGEPPVTGKTDPRKTAKPGKKARRTSTPGMSNLVKGKGTTHKQPKKVELSDVATAPPAKPAAPAGDAVAKLKKAIAAAKDPAAKAAVIRQATSLKLTHLLPKGWASGSTKSPKQAPVKKPPTV